MELAIPLIKFLGKEWLTHGISYMKLGGTIVSSINYGGTH